MADTQNKTEQGLAEIESNAGNRKLTQSEKCLLAILITAVCLAVVIVHWPATSAQALCFDDNRYFVENPLVRNPGWNSTWRFS